MLFTAITRESHRLDPLFLYPLVLEADGLADFGRYSEANQLLDAALRIEPQMQFGLWMKALVLVSEGRSADASDIRRRLEPGGLQIELLQSLDFLMELRTNSMPRPVVDGPGILSDRTRLTGHAVLILLYNGKTQNALDLLVKESEAGYQQPYDFLMLSPLLKPLREMPGFQPVLVRSRAQFDQAVSILQARRRGELPKYLEKALDDLLGTLGMKKA